MADGRSHENGWLDALRHLAVAGPLTANGLADRLLLDERGVRQRLGTMSKRGLVREMVNARGHKSYMASDDGLDLLRESPIQIRSSMCLVLVFEPVAPAVQGEFWGQVVSSPPLWVVRVRGPFRWIAVCRSSRDGDRLADALNAVGNPNVVASLCVAVEGAASIEELSRGAGGPTG